MNLQKLLPLGFTDSSQNGLGRVLITAAFLVVVCIGVQTSSANRGTTQGQTEDETVASKVTQQETENTEKKPPAKEDQSIGKVIGIKYNCVHVIKLEKTLKLYREILGFKMDGASVLHGPGIEGMLVMELKAGDCKVFLSLPAPDGFGLKPIGNTNHNHFMLLVDNIVPICDKLKAEGYELENDNYARDKYSFFTGPNGEIVGLTEYK